jgi:multidrug efflux pump subunit AcrA (membrane-fusion protein)
VKAGRSLVLAVVLGILLTACGGAPPAGNGPPPGADDTSRIFVVSDSYTTLAHECTPRQTVHITGSTDVIQLVEPCRAVTVSGSTNQVVIQATGTLSVGGQNQHVTVQKVTSGVIQLGGGGNELICGTRTLVQDSGSGNLTAGCTG